LPQDVPAAFLCVGSALCLPQVKPDRGLLYVKRLPAFLYRKKTLGYVKGTLTLRPSYNILLISKGAIILTETNNPSGGYITYGQMNLINDFRMLWTEIAIWLRSFMVSTITEFSDAKAISNRLYRIANDFKDKLQPFFGMEVAQNIQQLLLWYIINMQTMITALYYKDPVTVDNAVTSLYRISDELADYLASINPYWSKNQWASLLNGLNAMIIAEEVALIGSEYEREIDIRDRIFRQARLLGDYMAAGVMHYLVPEEHPIQTDPASLNCGDE
jgi:hypothetical protein